MLRFLRLKVCMNLPSSSDISYLITLNNILRRFQTEKVLTMQLSPSSLHFLSLRSIHYLKNSVFKHNPYFSSGLFFWGFQQKYCILMSSALNSKFHDEILFLNIRGSYRQ
jgi:hypothetical protein